MIFILKNIPHMIKIKNIAFLTSIIYHDLNHVKQIIKISPLFYSKLKSQECLSCHEKHFIENVFENGIYFYNFRFNTNQENIKIINERINYVSRLQVGLAFMLQGYDWELIDKYPFIQFKGRKTRTITKNILNYF
jgi:hypothetical protein